jgi:hypothetical protein
VADKFVILRCEGYTVPAKVDFAEVRNLIAEDLFEKKQRVAMTEEFDRLMEAAQIDNYLVGTTQPGKRGPETVRSQQPAPPSRPAPSTARQPAAAPNRLR